MDAENKIDSVEVLRQHNIWRRSTDEDLPMLPPALIGNAIDDVITEIIRLREIESAARNLIAAEGRHSKRTTYIRFLESLK